MRKIKRALMILPMLLLTGCSLPFSNIFAKSESADLYYVPFLEDDEYNDICSNETEYINQLDNHIFSEDESFSITYDFAYSDIDDLIEESSYRDIQDSCTDFSTSEDAEGNKVDSYNFTYNEYGYKNDGTDYNADETMGIPDDIYLRRGTKRSDSFDSFPIDERTHSVDVSSSEQLWFAVSHGYKPSCESGSEAEKMLSAAEDVCRQYISSDDSAVEKVRKIEAWLGNDVQYDLSAYEINDSDAWEDDCYYLEGVFNRHVAVCDGLAKAFVLLAGIENIPAVRVTGYIEENGTKIGHAWDYVMLNSKWYGVCPTSNDSIVSEEGVNYEIADKELFLVSKAMLDSYYTQESLPSYQADSDYGYFADTEIEYDGDTHNLVASSSSDLVFFTKLLNNYDSNGERKTIAFKIGYDYQTVSQLENDLKAAATSAGCQFYCEVSASNEAVFLSV